MSIDRDRIAEANEAIDRRARQRHAAALAQQQLTPEAIAAEEERQRINAAGFPNPGSQNGPAEPETGEKIISDLQADLNAALGPVLDGDETEPEIIGIGRVVFQWILVTVEEGEGYQLGIQLQVDEQPPAGFEADITPDLLAGWAKGKGLQGNRVEHKQFVAMLFERALTVGAGESGNQLIYILEQLMNDGATWVSGHLYPGQATETSVGEDEEPSTGIELDMADYDEDDGPFADAPENADEVPE